MPAADIPVNHIRVFLASPGGVEDERSAAREIARELNQLLSRHGWYIDLLGWEDRGPTGGRPQADINSDVERCDIFVGVLGNRWGTPTGDHSSGFAEEWSLAYDRHVRSGSPDLWLYFKQTPEASESDDANQRDRVAEFRGQIEATEAAFYKIFVGCDEFTTLLRNRLLDEVFRRSRLTRNDIGGIAIDWSAAYDADPVSLIPRGRDRISLVDELVDTEPSRAAAMLKDLATDLENQGFSGAADDQRIRACRALLAADETDEAIQLLRSVLGGHVWWLRLEDIDYLLRGLSDVLPPEFASELRGWRACWQAPEAPRDAAQELTSSLNAEHPFPLDDDTVALWRATQLRCLMHEGDVEHLEAAVDDIDPTKGDIHLELALVCADALRASSNSRADGAWEHLRALAAKQATSSPALAAWITTRAALDLVARHELSAAETMYADAATRWSHVEGGHEQAALAYFSAQAAGFLHDSWSFRGWGWRRVAAGQRSGIMSFARRAEELEERAVHHRLEGDDRKAIPLLVTALWCHQRAGLFHGVMKDLTLLADAYAALGDHPTAVSLYCRTGNGKQAAAAATKATDRAAVCRQVSGEFPPWSLEARCNALARAGRSAPSSVAEGLTPTLVETATPSEDALDNCGTTAADALAAVVVAIENPNVREIAADKLTELAASDHYGYAQPARLGLRTLCDVGASDLTDSLIEFFATDSRIDDPTPGWIADHLTTPERVERVRRAALGGHFRALLALIAAELVDNDASLLAYCRHITNAMLQSDLGMTPDGKGIVGHAAHDAHGAIAAASADKELAHAASEKLLLYACETRWPMVNRVSAVAGLWPLMEMLQDKALLDRLQPLAYPEADLNDPADNRWDWWTRPGDLQAMALKVCAAGAGQLGSSDWLDIAVSEATFDERDNVRQAAIFAAGSREEWFDSARIRAALADSSSDIRSTALDTWAKRSADPLPPPILKRLARDTDIGVRLALVRLMGKQPDSSIRRALLSDTDGYVRGIAQRRLVTEAESSPC